MKELSIEEKAKRYDYAIKRAEEYHKEGKTLEYTDDLVRELFPELKESEDEKIRKEIVRFIQMEVEDEIVGNKWLAWLKKRDEKGTNGNEREIPISKQKQDASLQINSAEYINDMGGNGCYLKNSGEFEVYNWLKSLKYKYTWKPSDD